ncbi:hypothetical protein Nepgr_029385 [Nepenthes gracilis]|uniref:RING-type domain-containing protein n=1 Tax=Nepenthes gracilis TaxID=150966 RepID=A0AAD3TF93_NEPGR|nr:hypothetical protein Nepgr_029385 [Nepenthes gracilis]
MDILLVTSSLSLSLLLLTCFYFLGLYSSMAINHSITPNRRVLIATHLRSSWSLLLYHTIFFHRIDYPNYSEEERQELPSTRHESNPDSAETAECRVCLCQIQQGEEIRELRCGHLFHRVCLDGWTGIGHTTCPLCRYRLAPPTKEGEDAEVICFQFCCSDSNGSRHR